VFDDGAKVCPAIGMALNRSKCGRHRRVPVAAIVVAGVSRRPGRGTGLHAQKVVTKGVIWVMVNSSGLPTCSMWPSFITATRFGHFQGLFLIVR